MTAFVFVGPTLDEKDRPHDGDVVYLPPVEQGHIHALVEKNPTAIGIIDGRFHDVPSVWHKEILWALRANIPVYGSASMGALRAAELAHFGMRGVGAIYELYRDGVLEDDDEVTVAHAGRDDHYVQLSDAMVNIRVNLALALEKECISKSTRDQLLDRAKNTYYAQRNLRLTLSEALAHGAPAREIEALSAFLRENTVDQKKIDALAMLDTMRQAVSPTVDPADDFPFEHNHFFDRARNNGLVYDGDGNFLRITQILDEVRLQPARYLHLRRRAIGTVMPQLIPDHPHTVRADTSASIAQFRKNSRLSADADWESWLTENNYAEEQFASLVRDEIISMAYNPYGGAMNTPLLGALQVDPSFKNVMRRTRAKKLFLEEQGFADPAGPGIPGALDGKILRWYFASISTPYPDDLYRYATSLDFQGGYEFMRAVREEFYFQHGSPAESALGEAGSATAHAAGDDIGHRITTAVWQHKWSSH